MCKRALFGFFLAAALCFVFASAPLTKAYARAQNEQEDLTIEQLSVFLKHNKPGVLASITEALKDANVNIRALSLTDSSDVGTLRLVVNKPEEAKLALQKNGFALHSGRALAIELEDKPGSLHSILAPLAANGINLEYVYVCIRPQGKNPTLIFSFDNMSEAITLLKKNKVNLVKAEQLYSK